MALRGGLKFSFAASALLTPGTAACFPRLRLRNPFRGLLGEAEYHESGTTFVLDPDNGALFKVGYNFPNFPALLYMQGFSDQ